MATLATLEQQIVAEYGTIVGWVKNHVFSSISLALAVGWILGHLIK